MTKPLIERIDDAIASYTEGAWVVETSYEKRMVPLLLEASRTLTQLEEEIALRADYIKRLEQEATEAKERER